jgi:hypothetical protein
MLITVDTKGFVNKVYTYFQQSQLGAQDVIIK